MERLQLSSMCIHSRALVLITLQTSLKLSNNSLMFCHQCLAAGSKALWSSLEPLGLLKQWIRSLARKQSGLTDGWARHYLFWSMKFLALFICWLGFGEHSCRIGWLALSCWSLVVGGQLTGVSHQQFHSCSLTGITHLDGSLIDSGMGRAERRQERNWGHLLMYVRELLNVPLRDGDTPCNGSWTWACPPAADNWPTSKYKKESLATIVGGSG